MIARHAALSTPFADTPIYACAVAFPISIQTCTLIGRRTYLLEKSGYVLAFGNADKQPIYLDLLVKLPILYL
jgi:hypothetical protein